MPYRVRPYHGRAESKKVLAVATAAVRNAVNGASFLKRVRLNTGIPMTIISGKAEAALGFSGVAHTIDRKDFLLFDLGGASVEISLVKTRNGCTPSVSPWAP